MQKRGQITIFIIIGIVVLFVIMGMVYLVRQQAEIVSPTAQTDNIRIFVEACLQSSTVNAMRDVFSKGGYLLSANLNTDSNLNTDFLNFTENNQLFKVPYYFQNEKVNVPSLAAIENAVSLATVNYFYNCTNNFSSLRESGYSIESGRASVDVKFGSSATVASLTYPMRVALGQSITNYADFSSTIPFSFKDKYSDIVQYTTEQKKYSQYFLAGTLSTLAYQRNYKFSFRQLSDDGSKVMVSLTYLERLGTSLLVYNFALNYDWTDLGQQLENVSEEEAPLQLNFMDEWNITQSGIAYYQVEALGEGLTFRAEPNTLPINAETGLITLDTANLANDEYLYYIEVADRAGRKTRGPLIINANVNDGDLPIIQPIGKLSAKVGQQFNFTPKILNPSKGPFTFYSESYLFNINSTNGEIKFIPAKDKIGVHSVRIDVNNSFGKTWQRWKLEIK